MSPNVIILIVLGFFSLPVLLGLGRLLGFWVPLPERQTRVYTLFGKVIGAIAEPGLNFPIVRLGPKVLLVPFFGKTYPVETSLKQTYVRNQMVNSEEGAPMGVGIWYESFVADPEAYLFRNSNPEGSLRANVATAVVKRLSNLRLDILLEDRHALSRTVREEVVPASRQWGFALGSTYIRKVSFRDVNMIHEIERKVVNRLCQVTAALRQDGENQVAIIRSQASREAAAEQGRAAAMRPRIVGQVLAEIGQDPEIQETLFAVLEIEAARKNPNLTLADRQLRIILNPAAT